MITYFFSDGVTSTSTLLILCLLAYIISSIFQRNKITHWGKRIGILVLFGLCLCLLVAIRDNYVGSVKNSIDTVSSVGIFTTKSIQSTLACIGGATILVSSILSIFLKKTNQRKYIFYVISFVFIFKLLLIEISRLLMV